MSKMTKYSYLKHCGKLIDVKVTIDIVDNQPVIYIRDYEFTDYDRALKFLGQIAENEMVGG